MPDQSAKRKLTTILAADVAGYSSAMAADEEATLATLRRYREVTDALVARHGGRVFSTAGDAFLAEFGSAVEAVRCAIAIQEDLAARNAQLPEASQMWFRIGINVGDVMIEKDDLFGDAVNVAARLEGLAETGGVCISGSTFEQVKNKLSIAFDDIGAQTVKNIPEPVAAFRIVPGRVAVVGSRPARRPGRGSRRNLVLGGAVLALLALGGAYLAGLLPGGVVPAHPFDGRWTVTLDGLSGCVNNTTRSFGVTVREGMIDEPDQVYPKKGIVAADGRVSITITDRNGAPRSAISATIAGNRGQGRLQGHRSACTGGVTLVRAD